MNRTVMGVSSAVGGLVALTIALGVIASPVRAVFLVVSGLGVLTALGTVMSRNLVRSALFLVAFFFLVACQFVLLEVDFLAAVQVLIAIGAVAILLMFGIMLTRDIQGDEPDRADWLRWVPAGAVTLGLLAMLCRGILADPIGPDSPDWTRQSRPSLVQDGRSLSSTGEVVNNLGLVIGQEMLGRWIVPFEMVALLLTAALVGSVAVAMGEGTDSEAPGRIVPRLRASAPERTA